MKRLNYFALLLLLIGFGSSLLVGQTASIYYGPGTDLQVGAGADMCSDNITLEGTYSGDGTKCNAPLPVELLSFSAEVRNNQVTLFWQTATEVNNYGFEIERSSNSRDLNTVYWQNIGFVIGGGNSNSTKQYSFSDNTAGSGKYGYRLKQIDNDGIFDYSGVVYITVETPEGFALQQNFPNPFNPTTAIQYSIKEPSPVSIIVYDMAGNQVSVLVNETKQAGTYTVQFDASSLSSGVYGYQMKAGSFSDYKKLILMK